MFDFPNQEAKEQFQNDLLDWFSINGRHFPWRETRDAYAILLVEKLLQQTSVRDSIIRIYEKLLEDYPSAIELAEARVEDLRALIQPLGLHYRANDLVLLGKYLKENHGGKVPSNLKDLLSIYGVGDYSARAVLSFAYGEDTPVIDTNVARIMFRVFGINRKFPVNPARSEYLIELASYLVPAGRSREFNWANIDLGALVCKPIRPKCDLCPLNHLCKHSKSELFAFLK